MPPHLLHLAFFVRGSVGSAATSGVIAMLALKITPVSEKIREDKVDLMLTLRYAKSRFGTRSNLQPFLHVHNFGTRT